MKKMLLFDIDGTLLLTGGAGKVAFDRAFKEVLSVDDAWGDTAPHGKTDPVIVSEIAHRTIGRAITEEEYDRLTELYSLYFGEAIGDSPLFRLMPGVPELLERLAEDKNYFLGIQTGNLEETARHKLERGNIAHYFSFGGYGSDSGDRPEILASAIKRGKKLHKTGPILPRSLDVLLLGCFCF